MAKRRPASERTKRLKENLEKRTQPKKHSLKELVSCGVTRLNLALSSTIFGAFLKGMFVHLVGDSDSGKTWLGLSVLAEACNNPEFDDYQIIYDNGEDGALMDLEHYFGSKFAGRVEAPFENEDGDPICSETVEEFYAFLQERRKHGPFIWLLDSMDVLRSIASDTKFEDELDAMKGKGKLKGSYGDGKAKVNSQMLRRAVADMKRDGSILIIISQTREDISPLTFTTKTHSGGKALKFYASVQIWLAVSKAINKTIKGKSRRVGSLCRAKITKGRMNGIKEEIEFPIYNASGIDDVEASVDYLLSEKHWTKAGQKINAPEFDFEGTKEKLIQTIEGNDDEAKLSKLVEEVWQAILDAAPKRKKRYE